jgi:hypothetical protein
MGTPWRLHVSEVSCTILPNSALNLTVMPLAVASVAPAG